MECRKGGYFLSWLLAFFLMIWGTLVTKAEDDPREGVRAYTKECLSCHSLQKGRHRSGPSLFGIMGRKVGSAEGFSRYSDALVGSTFIWTPEKLDIWLANPQSLIPGNLMSALVSDPKTRENIIQYLVSLQENNNQKDNSALLPHEKILDLKSVGPSSQISEIRYCNDTYAVKLANGALMKFWENNLRFKTDSSSDGPLKGQPVLVPSGMHGDRFYVIFASPEEIGRLIQHTC